MNILSYKPGHDGSIVSLRDGQLAFCFEAEKDSGFRHSELSVDEVLQAFGQIDEAPDVVCTSGWWPQSQRLAGALAHAGYRGVTADSIFASERRLLGRNVKVFSSSHERSHLLSAFGMSDLPKGTPCYALVWEGLIGALYRIDSDLSITTLADVMSEPGHRYALLYGIADPTFSKASGFSRLSDAGKLMALAAYSNRRAPTPDEERLTAFLLQPSEHLPPRACTRDLAHFEVGLDDVEFRNFAGIFHDKLFDLFYQAAKSLMTEGLPLLIAGGCGLSCDWNSRWRTCGLFSSVFVPPVANDSGSAIGTAIDAQFFYTGNPKIAWDVYSGREFSTSAATDLSAYDVFPASFDEIADVLGRGFILGWVQGRYEIGPRALGARSILASPFEERTRIRLNEIKQREQFRPIAPVCLEEDASQWFGCDESSPYMLFTQAVRTDALAAVTHVDNTARIQTVSRRSNEKLHRLLTAFKAKYGFGVLCNTSLNFKGRGFINNITDLCDYTTTHGLDGFVIDDLCYLRKASPLRRVRANG